MTAFSASGDAPRTPIGTVDGSNNIPTTRVWADYAAGNLATTEVVFHRDPISGFSPLVVSPEFEWEISTARTGYGSAEVTFKGLGVAGETDWQGLILVSEDGGSTWYAPQGQQVNSLLHEITVADQVFPGRYALVTAPDTATPELKDAVFTDQDEDSLVEAGEVLSLIFDRGVVVNAGAVSAASFALPVSGDALGTGFSVASNAFNSRQVDITLGASPTLTIPGAFNPGSTGSGSPSGVGLAAGIDPMAIRSLAGRPATGAPVDIDFNLVENTVNVPTTGGIATVTNSPDAAYTQHRMTVPSGALAAATDITMRAALETGGLIRSVQITSNPPSATFSVPATLRLEYRDSDLDTELGDIEDAMRIHQLVETSPSVFEYQLLLGSQMIDTVANTVEHDITTLDPLGTSGPVGIFATLPVSPVILRTLHIKPGGGGVVRHGPGDPALTPGNGSLYDQHRVEFPGYVLATPGEPGSYAVTMRTANIIERISGIGGTSFPVSSDAVFVVQTCDASGEMTAFPDPVVMRVEFRPSDMLTFDGDPAHPNSMHPIRDAIDGPQTNFAFASGVGLTVTSATTEMSDVTGLTGPSGLGVWGAVGGQIVPVELSVFRAD